MMEIQRGETSSSTRVDQSTGSSEDGMRTRVRLFAEAVVKMASPVLLALELRKVNLRGEGTWFVRASISTLAALAMALGVLLMVFLWLRLSKLVEGLKRLNYAASKLFVHLCAILLVSLASEILVLISVKCQLYVVGAPPLALLVVLCYLCCWRRDEARDAAMNAVAGCDRELENSVDFSAGLTTLVFLGLERLALEVHLTSSSNGRHSGSGMPPDDHLESCLALSFTACVIGVVIMLVWTIPPPIRNYDWIIAMRGCIEASNVALALFITVIMVQITWAPLKAMALWVIVPPLISLLWGIYIHFDSVGEQGGQGRQERDRTAHHVVNIEPRQPPHDDDAGGGDGDGSPQGGHQPQDHGGQPPQGVDGGLQENDKQQQQHSEVKPPSLELTKFAFAAFLTVSIPSISACSPLSVWTHAFILLTALSVVSALVWRLLGHRAKPSRAEVAAANIASSFAHGFAVMALVPFALMADRNARLAVPPCPQN